METQAITAARGNSVIDTKRELIVLIDKEGFELDWQEIEEPMEKGHFSAQQDLFEKWRENPYKALFRLGFTGFSVPVSDSLRFLYNAAPKAKGYSPLRKISS